MTGPLLGPVLLGLDGFVVCLALGALNNWVRSALPLVASFGLSDGLALLAGGAVDLFLPSSGPVLPALLGLWLLLVLLAFDNLLAGAAAGRAVTLEDAALSCVVSTALAGAGLLAGRALALRLRPRHARLAGAGFCSPRVSRR